MKQKSVFGLERNFLSKRLKKTIGSRTDYSNHILSRLFRMSMGKRACLVVRHKGELVYKLKYFNGS